MLELWLDIELVSRWETSGGEDNTCSPLELSSLRELDLEPISYRDLSVLVACFECVWRFLSQVSREKMKSI